MLKFSNGCPRADDTLRSGRDVETGDGDFEDEGPHVVCGEVVVLVGLNDGSGKPGDGDKVEAVEDASQVNGEGLLALSDEDSTLRRAARDGDVVEVLARVGWVVREGLLAGVVHRPCELAASTVSIGNRLWGVVPATF